MSDIAAAYAAALDRNTPANTASMRKATVTDDSPFTISMNGTTIVGVPFSPRYTPIVGDVVLVLMDGAAPYVLEAIDRGGLAYSGKFLFGTALAPSGTSIDLTVTPTPLAPANGLVQVAASFVAGFASGTVGTNMMIYSNSYATASGAAVQTRPTGTVTTGGGVWGILDDRQLIYPCTAGAAVTPVIRLSWTPSTQIWYQGTVLVNIYAD